MYLLKYANRITLLKCTPTFYTTYERSASQMTWSLLMGLSITTNHYLLLPFYFIGSPIT
jgi:hypothetical protein